MIRAARLLAPLSRAALLLLAAGCGHPAAEAPPPTPVRVQAPVVGAPGGAARYSAPIMPGRRVDLAFKVPGYIAALATVPDGRGRTRPIQEGDRVRSGEVLARIRPTDFTNKVDQARSQQAEAEAGLAQAKQAYERASALYERKSLTRAEFEAAKAAYDAMLAKQAGAGAVVAEARSAQADAALRSPMNGVVLKRLVEVGSLVGPGTPGFVLADLSSVKMQFGAPDTVFRTLSLQRPVEITTAAYPESRFRGRVTSLAPAADPGSLVFDVEVTVPNGDGRLKPGMVASLELAPPQEGTAPAVPLAAIVRSASRPDGYSLYVVEEKDRRTVARRRDVTLGPMVAGGVSVTAGLRPGDRVIVSGATVIADGEAVEVLR